MAASCTAQSWRLSYAGSPCCETGTLHFLLTFDPWPSQTWPSSLSPTSSCLTTVTMCMFRALPSMSFEWMCTEKHKEKKASPSLVRHLSSILSGAGLTRLWHCPPLLNFETVMNELRNLGRSNGLEKKKARIWYDRWLWHCLDRVSPSSLFDMAFIPLWSSLDLILSLFLISLIICLRFWVCWRFYGWYC